MQIMELHMQFDAGLAVLITRMVQIFLASTSATSVQACIENCEAYTAGTCKAADFIRTTNGCLLFSAIPKNGQDDATTDAIRLIERSSTTTTTTTTTAAATSLPTECAANNACATNGLNCDVRSSGAESC